MKRKEQRDPISRFTVLIAVCTEIPKVMMRSRYHRRREAVKWIVHHRRAGVSKSREAGTWIDHLRRAGVIRSREAGTWIDHLRRAGVIRSGVIILGGVVTWIGHHRRAGVIKSQETFTCLPKELIHI